MDADYDYDDEDEFMEEDYDDDQLDEQEEADADEADQQEEGGAAPAGAAGGDDQHHQHHHQDRGEIIADSQGRKLCRLCSIREGEVTRHFPLQLCAHAFCRDCMVKYLVSNPKLEAVLIYNEKFTGLTCPLRGCGKLLTRQDIRAVAGMQVVDFLDSQVIKELFKKQRRSLGGAMESLIQAVVELGLSFEKFAVAGKSQLNSVDASLGKKLGKLTEAVPGAMAENTYLMEVLLCRDPTLANTLAFLLRNDSTMDISERSELYLQMLAFMRLVTENRMLYPLLHSSEGYTDCWTLDLVAMEHKSVIYLFENLHKQASFILENNLQIGSKAVRLLTSCKEVYEQLMEPVREWRAEVALHPWFSNAHEFFTERFPGVLPAEEGSNSDKLGLGKEISKHKEKMSYVLSLKPHQFGQAKLMASHYFRTVLQGFGRPSSTRSRRIAREIATLATNMPLEYHSSIHIRVDEERLDCLRAVIIGPEGTPYEDGVFLFDMMLPEDYPDNSPTVQYLTTGGGLVRFNPNLYDCGKVCLSLLGTWEGPKWISGDSTILQVLVSIQSLVLNAEPFYNEPGYVGGNFGSESKKYNVEQKYNTLVHSMLPALKNPDPLFADLIRAHFEAKRRAIEEQCEKWKDERTPGCFTTNRTKLLLSMGSAVELVKKELASQFD